MQVSKSGKTESRGLLASGEEHESGWREGRGEAGLGDSSWKEERAYCGRGGDLLGHQTHLEGQAYYNLQILINAKKARICCMSQKKQRC